MKARAWAYLFGGMDRGAKRIDSKKLVTPGDILAERFVLERVAGSGAMGVVFRAQDKLTGGAVALKVMRASASPSAFPMGGSDKEAGHRDTERFSREVQVLAELDHPGIVRYVAHGHTPSGSPYLAMEWLEGESLAERLSRERLTMAESVMLGLRVAEALRTAHDRSIVHRDLKPSNLFLVGGSIARVKILDFGIARPSDAKSKLTITGVTMGTPGDMSPEQARGERLVDARADVFSLGCVLFKCVTQKPAFPGDDIVAVLLRIALEDAPRASELRSDVPPELDALLARMLSKSPDERPRDAGEVAAALAAIDVLDASKGSFLQEASPITLSLTTTEQRMLCVVLARLAGSALTSEDARDPAVIAAAGRFGGQIDLLGDDTFMAITFLGTGAATDQAARAARCALAIRPLLREVPMVVASGNGVLASRLPKGDVVEHGVAMLVGAPLPAALEGPGAVAPIFLDEVSASLLDATFDVSRASAGLILRGEHEAPRAARTLLGKPTPCVGRDRELATLEAVLEECISEPIARPVLLTAPAGVGKSRLRDELLKRIRRRRDPIEVWVGRGDPISTGSPFGMITPAIRRASGILDGEPLSTRRKKLLALASRHLEDRDAARVAEFLGELTGAPFPDEESVQLRAARRDPMLMGDQIRRAWEDLLEAECIAHPVLIVLDDVQWGDLPSVMFIDGALRHLRDRPLMVLALARPEVSELFPRLWDQRGLMEIRLLELTRKASERLAREVLGEAVSPETIAFVVERSEGNAFYLEELIRAVVDGRSGALPETVLAMVQARLDKLDPEARRVLRAASVFGRVFWRGGVAALLGGEDKVSLAGEWLSMLEREEIASRRGASRFTGDAEYALRHALVHEAAYAMLTAEDRRLGHGLAGEWLERAGETEAVLLAEHFERSADPLRAVSWYRRAASQALEGNDLAAVLSRSERGIACGASGEDAGALRLLQAEAHNWNGSYAEAEQCGRAAAALLPRGRALWLGAVMEIAEATGRRRLREKLAAVAEELLATGPGSHEGSSSQFDEIELPTMPWRGPSAGGAVVLHLIASVNAATHLFMLGDTGLGERMLDRIEAQSVDVADREPAVAARIHRLRAYRALRDGDPATYLTLMEAAVGCFEQAGDLRSACMQQSNVGFAHLEIGAYELAKGTLVDALAIAERLGLSHTAAVVKHNLGMALARAGQIEAALAVERAATQTFVDRGDKKLEEITRIYLATVLTIAGDLAQAAKEAAAAAAISGSLSSPMKAFALATLGRIRLGQGSALEALEVASEAMRILESLGGMEEGEALVRLTYAQALDMMGRRAEACEVIAAARERLLSRAARIRNEAWRESFLHRVLENARTLEIARLWLDEAPGERSADPA